MRPPFSYNPFRGETDLGNKKGRFHVYRPPPHMGAVVQYAKTRPVFDGYKAARYSKKYLAQHEAELSDYRAAQQNIREAVAVKANIDHLLIWRC